MRHAIAPDRILAHGIAKGVTLLVRDATNIQSTEETTDIICKNLVPMCQEAFDHYPEAFGGVIRALEPDMIEPVFLYLLAGFARVVCDSSPVVVQSPEQDVEPSASMPLQPKDDSNGD